MNRLQLFWLLRRNNRLGYRRSPAFEQSMVAKVLMVLGGGMMVIYLIIYGVMFATIANDDRTPYLLMGILPLLLVVDFFLRFMVQQTPAMLVKPYVLLPLPRHAVIEAFLLSSLLSTYNWLWLFLFVPYTVIVMAGGALWWEGLSILLCGMLLLMVNSQFYLMVRTLIARHLLWWLLPVVVYGAYFVSLIIDTEGQLFSDQCDLLVAFAASPWFVLLCVGLLASLFAANRAMQFAYVYEEISRQEKKNTAPKHIAQFAFLEHFGVYGEYLKLELKSVFRNKAIRARVYSSIALIVILSLLIAYTDIYDGRLMLNFWCYYCFAIYGMTTLAKVMGPEGNYIDLLMTHREHILALLTAKYYFYCCVLFVPLLIMMPAVIAGKFSWLMMLAYMLFSSGVLYFILFQLVVYNKQTLPLDQKITGKGNIENGLQLLIESVAMLLPSVMLGLLVWLFSDVVAYLVMASVGLFFTLAHPLWLRHIYQRMMKRKYENLEGFHATR